MTKPAMKIAMINTNYITQITDAPGLCAISLDALFGLVRKA